MNHYNFKLSHLYFQKLLEYGANFSTIQNNSLAKRQWDLRENLAKSRNTCLLINISNRQICIDKNRKHLHNLLM